MPLVFILSACDAGSGEGLDENGDLINGNASIPLADNFKSIQNNVFSVNCALSGCHSGASPQQNMSLEEGKSLDAILNFDSAEVPNLKRILPNDADNSYLIHKIEGRAASGQRMPLNLPSLSAEKINAIKSWINKGALVPRLSSIQSTIFTPVCTVCHGGVNPAAGMNLEAGSAYSNLVGIKRSFDPEIRVVAGSANDSFIIDKLENTNLGGSRGDQMPLGGPYLAEDQIQVIRDWINAGAKND